MTIITLINWTHRIMKPTITKLLFTCDVLQCKQVWPQEKSLGVINIAFVSL